MENGDKTRKDGMPVGVPFTSEYQPEGRGRPKGALSLETRIRNILEGNIELPESLIDVIRAQCGGDKRAIDAVVIVGLLQALQGDKGWADLLLTRGYGKPTESVELSGRDGEPINTRGELTVTLVRAKGSADG